MVEIVSQKKKKKRVKYPSKKEKKKHMGEIYTLALKYGPEISIECF